MEARIASLLDRGRAAQAERAARQVALETATPELVRLLAVSRARQGDWKEAGQLLRRSLRRAPSCAAHSDLGVLLARRGDWRRAAAEFARALESDPDDRAARLYLAASRRKLGDTRHALALYREILGQAPADLEALEGLVATFRESRDLEGSLPDLERALEVRPRDRRIRNWTADAYFEHGREEMGCDELLRGRCLSKGRVESIRIHGRLADLKQTPKSLLAAFSGWIRENTSAPERAIAPRPRRTAGKLRIGYLTGEFTRGPAYFFVMPLLRYRAPGFEAFGYHSRAWQDHRTEEFREYCHGFRDVARWADERIAEQVRKDRIDVLVDLSGHFDDSRLGVFRHRPAPVSFTFPNYPATTGVPEIDYIFTDRWMDPPGSARKYVERPWYLPSGYLAYHSPRKMPDVGPPPVLDRGYVTFGLLQQPLKLHAGIWDAAARCLLAVRKSRLIVHYVSQDLHHAESAACRRMREEFSRRGVDPSRISFRGRLPRDEHLRLRSEIDINLDTFPYNGQTTTCESLWLGVPTVTLAGETHVSRVGYSLLSRVGLGDWIATSVDEYVEIAARKAADVAGLVDLRTRLRGMTRRGLDGRRLAREVHAAYREACAGPNYPARLRSSLRAGR